MSQIDDDITQIEIEEGGDKVTVDPSDRGGRTQYGISEKSNPEAWKDGVVTEAEAREIYMQKYVITPKFNLITNPHLQSQLIDYGVNSGTYIAIQKLQTILGILPDGIIGPGTLDAISKYSHPDKLNNLLVAERIKMICKIVVKDATQLKYLNGWTNRALEFIV